MLSRARLPAERPDLPSTQQLARTANVSGIDTGGANIASRRDTVRKATVGVALISALASSGCNGASERRERADRASAELVIKPSDPTRTHEKYLRRLQTKLVDLDLDIAKLASRARMERPEGRKHSEHVLADIRTKRMRLANNVRALGPTAAEEWDESRILVEREWIELSQLVSQAFVTANLRVRSY